MEVIERIWEYVQGERSKRIYDIRLHDGARRIPSNLALAAVNQLASVGMHDGAGRVSADLALPEVCWVLNVGDHFEC